MMVIFSGLLVAGIAVYAMRIYVFSSLSGPIFSRNTLVITSSNAITIDLSTVWLDYEPIRRFALFAEAQSPMGMLKGRFEIPP